MGNLLYVSYNSIKVFKLGITKKVKKQAKNWKLSATYITIKELVIIIYKDLIELNKNKANNLIKNGQKIQTGISQARDKKNGKQTYKRMLYSY